MSDSLLRKSCLKPISVLKCPMDEQERIWMQKSIETEMTPEVKCDIKSFLSAI